MKYSIRVPDDGYRLAPRSMIPWQRASAHAIYHRNSTIGPAAVVEALVEARENPPTEKNQGEDAKSPKNRQ